MFFLEKDKVCIKGPFRAAVGLSEAEAKLIWDVGYAVPMGLSVSLCPASFPSLLRDAIQSRAAVIPPNMSAHKLTKEDG